MLPMESTAFFCLRPVCHLSSVTYLPACLPALPLQRLLGISTTQLLCCGGDIATVSRLHCHLCQLEERPLQERNQILIGDSARLWPLTPLLTPLCEEVLRLSLTVDTHCPCGVLQRDLHLFRFAFGPKRCWKLANWQFRLCWIPSLLLVGVAPAPEFV